MEKEDLIKIIREEIHDILKERSLSSPEKNNKEKYVRSLKKSAKYLKNKYGDRWKNVMYAIATKQAKENVSEREMTKAEIRKRDDIADELKKKKKEFQKKYGENWEDVLYATATNIAMGDKEHAD